MYIKIKNIYKKVEEIISQCLFYLHFLTQSCASPFNNFLLFLNKNALTPPRNKGVLRGTTLYFTYNY